MPIRRRRNVQGDILLKKSITLTNDQIKALPTTPVEIVAAPGSGKMIVVFFAVFSCNVAAGAYTNFNTAAAITANPFASSVYLALDAANNFNDATGPIVAGASDGVLGLLKRQSVNVSLIDGVNGNLLTLGPISSPSYTLGIALPASAGFDNVNLSVVGQNNNLGNFTGGNAANTMKVTVYYDIVDI